MEDLSGAVLYGLKTKGKTRAQIAAFTGLTMGQVGGRIWRHEQMLKGGKPDDRRLFTFDKDKPLTLDGDWMIIGDVHAPTTDYDFAQLVGLVAQKLGITRLLIAGDILNNDIFSTHPKEDEPVPWQREKAAARQLIQEWLEVFDTVVWSAGNHERRLSKQTWGALGMEDMRQLIADNDSRVQTTRYGYVTIRTPMGDWRITHPKRYGTRPLAVANKIAMHYGVHVWSFHEHHFGVTWSDNGKHLLVNGGGLFEPENLDYVVLDDTAMPSMVKGFGALVGGYPTLYGPEPYTNWTTLLNEAERPALAIAA